MGWNDSHLHQFEIPRGRGKTPLLIGIPSSEDEFRDAEVRPLAGWEQRIAGGREASKACVGASTRRHFDEREVLFSDPRPRLQGLLAAIAEGKL